MHPSRNPHLTREQIEAELSEMLGLDKVIWLHKGMAGDDAVRPPFGPLLSPCIRTSAGACCAFKTSGSLPGQLPEKSVGLSGGSRHPYQIGCCCCSTAQPDRAGCQPFVSCGGSRRS